MEAVPTDTPTVKVSDWTMGERMWKARKVAGLEQLDVSRVLGVSRALVSRWEHDLSEPSPSQLRRFVALIDRADVTIQWIVDGVEGDDGRPIVLDRETSSMQLAFDLNLPSLFALAS